jgi:hypothetical protein
MVLMRALTAGTYGKRRANRPDTGGVTEALAAAQQTYEPGQPSISTKQSNLARVLQDLSDLEAAKDLLIKAYEAFKNRLGEDHSNTLTVKGNLDLVESEIQNSD